MPDVLQSINLLNQNSLYDASDKCHYHYYGQISRELNFVSDALLSDIMFIYLILRTTLSSKTKTMQFHYKNILVSLF